MAQRLLLPGRGPALATAWCAAALVAGTLAATGAQAAPDWALMPPGLLPQRLPVATPTGAAWQVQTEAADFSGSDATAVRGFGGDWTQYHPRSGRNTALQQARLDLRLTHGDWELGATLRSDMLVSGTRGSFDLVHAYKQRQTLADGSTLRVAAQEQGLVWAGLRAARSWTLLPADGAQAAGLRLTAAVTPLHLRRLRLSTVQGSVQSSGAGGYGFDASTLRQDSHRQFGGMGQDGATGSGITSDLGLLWQPGTAWFANLSVVDALSRLRIQNLATETMRLSSATAQLDGRGYVDYQPLLNGHNSATDLRLRLWRKWSATAGVQADRLWAAAPAGSQLGARWEHIGGLGLPAVWASLPLPMLAPGWALQIDAEARFGSLGLGLQGPQGALMLRSSGSRVGQASALGWQASVNLPW
jgi:hypothetical protein